MPIQFEESIQPDSQIQFAGDSQFIGLDNRQQPEQLPESYVQVSENMRLNQLQATVRKGMEKQTNSISFSNTPLVLPFVIGTNSIILPSFTDGIFYSQIFSDPNTNLEWIMVATGVKTFMFSPGQTVTSQSYPSTETVNGSDKVDMFQAGGSMYMLRGLNTAYAGIASIYRSGTTATVTTSASHGLSTGQWVTITGSYPAWYNTTAVQVTVTSLTAFTYTVVSPTNLADSLLETATTAEHTAKYSYTYSAKSYILSVYAKPNSRNYIRVLSGQTSGGNPVGCFFNLSAGTVGTATGSATGTISSAGDGWYRCSIKFTAAAGAANATIEPSTDGSTTSYAGDITKGLYLFGAQLEQATAITNYQNTNGSAGTRNLFTYSEDFSNAIWTKTDSTATNNTTEEPATGTVTFAQLKIPLRWDGDQTQSWVVNSYGTISGNNIYMPTSDFGLVQSDRAILQYARNKLLASYIENVNQYDTIYGQFNIAQGQADYLIGFFPYQQAQTIVFNRHSIYLMNNTNGDVANVSVQELTRQNGCVGRRTAATCGASVLFLSDRGVFQLQPGLELLLRGASEPLSAPIDPTIKTINFTYASGACAAYCNNRYYLAVPVDGSTRNNALLVYNFINKAWESIDSFPNGFYCDYMVTSLLNNQQTLFVISKEGGIYAYEQLEFDEYSAASEPAAEYTIEGKIRTRRYIFDTPALKRFNAVTTNFNLNANNSWDITAYGIKPDITKELPSISSTYTNTETVPRIVGLRGYGLEIEYLNTNQTGGISNLTVSAFVQDRKYTTTH